MAWLNSRPLRSVVYVSFGSMVRVTRGQLLEFWYGLVNSESSNHSCVLEELEDDSSPVPTVKKKQSKPL